MKVYALEVHLTHDWLNNFSMSASAVWHIHIYFFFTFIKSTTDKQKVNGQISSKSHGWLECVQLNHTNSTTSLKLIFHDRTCFLRLFLFVVAISSLPDPKQSKVPYKNNYVLLYNQHLSQGQWNSFFKKKILMGSTPIITAS